MEVTTSAGSTPTIQGRPGRFSDHAGAAPACCGTMRSRSPSLRDDDCRRVSFSASGGGAAATVWASAQEAPAQPGAWSAQALLGRIDSDTWPGFKGWGAWVSAVPPVDRVRHGDRLSGARRDGLPVGRGRQSSRTARVGRGGAGEDGGPSPGAPTSTCRPRLASAEGAGAELQEAPSVESSQLAGSGEATLAARGRRLFAEPACSGSLAMSD